MGKRLDEGALLDKIGAPRGTQYEVRHEGLVGRLDETVRPAKREFILAFHLRCPVCDFDDFIKLGNGHRADKLEGKAPF